MNRLVYMDKLGRNDLCWCKSGRRHKKCHSDFDARLEELVHRGVITPPRSIIKNQEQIQRIRENGKINITVLDCVSGNIKEGTTMKQIDQWVYEQTVENHVVPAPLNFGRFSEGVCISVNDQVCHGIPPSNVVLCQGDIINVDASTTYNGYSSDPSGMFCIGQVSEERKHPVEVMRKSLDVGLKQTKLWGLLGSVSQAIHGLTKENGYTVVKEIDGHGVGLELYEEPWVSYVSKQDTEALMAPDVVFTTEPMISTGSDKIFTNEEGGWIVCTEDGQPSAR